VLTPKFRGQRFKKRPAIPLPDKRLQLSAGASPSRYYWLDRI